MQKTLIRYRTTDVRTYQYAVIPTIWVSDLLEWLMLSECAEVVQVTHDYDSVLIIPVDWPSHQTCQQQAHLSALIESR